MTVSSTSQQETFGPFFNVSEIEKQSYHQQLVLLLHAYKCERRDSTNEVREACILIQCPGARNLLSHIQICKADYTCGVANCALSKTLLIHWKKCPHIECALCSPLLEAHERRQMRHLIHQTSHADQGENHALERESISQLQNQLSQAVQQLNIQLQNNDLVSNTSPATHLNVTENDSSTETSASLMNSVSSQISTLIPNVITCVPTNVKDWQQSVTSDLRRHLIQRIIQEILVILNKKDLNDPNDPAVMNVINYARRSEAVMYDSANTRDEYYHLLAEKIYKIQKRELSDNRQHLREIHRSQVGAVLEANMHPFSNISEMERQSYHQQLVLLLHAYKCQKHESTNGEEKEKCRLAQCQGMRCVINHIKMCQAGNTCDVANCVSSKALILHWKGCTQTECALCLPIKQGHGRRQQ